MIKKIFKCGTILNHTFELRPVTKENCEAVANLYCDVFLKEPVLYYFGIERGPLLEYDCYPLAKFNAEMNYGLSCYDLSTNQLVGTLLYDDANKIVSKYVDSAYPALKKACAFNNLYKQDNEELFNYLSKSEEGWLHGTGFSVDEKYQSLGLGKVLQDYSLYEHPVLKNIRYFTFDSTSPISKRIAQKLNFEEVWFKSWEQISQIPGYEYYLDMYKGILDMGMPIQDGYSLFLFDRKRTPRPTQL